MKKVRLDEILFKSGKLTEEVLQKALLRQKARGGRLGTHLIYYGVFSENEMAAALSEQYRIPGVELSGMEIHRNILDRLPVTLADELMAIPFGFNKTTRELHVAVADPDRPKILPMIQRACGTPDVVLHIAPEVVIRREIDRHYRGKERSAGNDSVVAFPELFVEPEDGEKDISDVDAAPVDETFLLLTRQAYLRNVLPSLLARENINLAVADSAAEAAEFIKASGCARILVSEECRTEFDKIAFSPENIGKFPEVSYFQTVGVAIIENPAPYRRMIECLLASLQDISVARNPAGLTALALIHGDIVEVGRLLRLPNLVIDGLRVGAHLLTQASPGKAPVDLAAKENVNRFPNIDASVEAARRLAFPWDVVECLKALKGGARVTGQMAVASGLLSLVWHRHYSLSTQRAGSGGELETLKSRLRVQAGRMAPSSVVEAYIRVLEQHDQGVGGGQDIFIVGGSDPLPENLFSELHSHGFRIMKCENLQEARKAYLRRRPAAILLHVDSSRSDTDAFCRYIRKETLDADTALLAITHRNEPSFLLNLMDTWFNDVLPMPIDAPVAVARISRALSYKEKEIAGRSSQGFSATFKDLPFVDLVQTLTSSGRDVRMVVDGPLGQRSEIYFREGKIVFSVTGKIEGPDAVYEVIMWQTEGSFRVEAASVFPESNVKVPTDYILLEGLRRLDEGLARK